LATRHVVRHRIGVGYALGILGYGAGLVVSTVSDLPSGPAIVWIMTALAILFVFALGGRILAR
jgi:zinc/manganese transport system permease protein